MKQFLRTGPTDFKGHRIKFSHLDDLSPWIGESLCCIILY